MTHFEKLEGVPGYGNRWNAELFGNAFEDLGSTSQFNLDVTGTKWLVDMFNLDFTSLSMPTQWFADKFHLFQRCGGLSCCPFSYIGSVRFLDMNSCAELQRLVSFVPPNGWSRKLWTPFSHVTIERKGILYRGKGPPGPGWSMPYGGTALQTRRWGLRFVSTLRGNGAEVSSLRFSSACRRSVECRSR